MNKPVILCVDDEKIVLDSLKSQLRKEFAIDYDLEIAESAEEALEIIEELMEEEIEIPLVISDQIMPGMKGDELLIKLENLNPGTLKILLTGQSSADAVGNALNHAKLYRYISKPWDSTDLVMTIKEATKSFFQNKTLEWQNRELIKLNESLEEKVRERTAEVVKAKEIIEKKNANITASINYAYRIQSTMLPLMSELKSNLPESFVLFKPRDIVSGDFYWWEEKDDKFVITAVDCTGHGVPGAILSMIGIEQLVEIVNLYEITHAELILEYLHKGVRKILKQHNGENKDGMDMSLCTIDRKNNVLEFSGAKNPMIYIQDDENGIPVATKVKGDKESIGGFQKYDERRFTRHEIPLDKPTCFYIFSDGYQDQFGGPENRKFMIKKFRQLLLEIHTLPFDEQKQILDDTIEKWMENERQLDDILVIGFKI